MLAVKYQNYCLTRKLLQKSFVLSKKFCVKGQNGGGNFSKTIPKIFYVHNPLTFLWTRFQLARMRLLWDREFDLNEFCKGTKQAASVMTDFIRKQDQLSIGHFTTPIGYEQITNDMNFSKNDARIKLLHFRFEDIHRAVPVHVVFFKKGNNKNCFIDMLFVGMRNTKDFQNSEERQVISRTLDQLERQMNVPPDVIPAKHRVIFSEIYMRFFRNYTPRVPGDWSVSFYKIVSFDVWNFV
ncbi:uncharacterized protein LOC129948463 [Eupeodes corollae]|uniref:uncharacterized protein LOC129948463 n=1 Tax=Eupeodes corollae TaxID=290404 RepID=UPI002490C886|nr:uncharacterized protein LOC129948463 [Eupeodes corollae]